jgi:transcriptional regulator with XRE-family HTH domain
MTLGAAIKRLRNAAGLSQRELAERIQVDASYLSHLEADRREPSLGLLRSLARELNIHPGLLLAVAFSVELPEEANHSYEPWISLLLEQASTVQFTLPMDISQSRPSESIMETIP